MTGCEDQQIFEISTEEEKAGKSILSPAFRAENPYTFTEVFTEPDESGDMGFEEFFGFLKEADGKNWMLAAVALPKPKKKQRVREDG